jgi:hypothetical protein
MRVAARTCVLALVPLATALGCGGEPPRPMAVVAVAPQAPSPAAAPKEEGPPSRSLRVELSFDDRGLHVRVVATGPPAELGDWALAAGAEQNLEIRSADGSPVPFSRAPIAITVAPRASIAIRYDVRAETSSDDPRATVVEPSRFRATGERFLALPRAWTAGGKGEKPSPITLVLDASATDAHVVASTFGAASAATTTTLSVAPEELRRATYMAGGGGRAQFDAPEGHDEAAWVGFTAFDPRAVAAEVAGFRTLLHEYFFGKEARPSTLLLYVDARAKGTYRAARVSNGVLVTLSGNDAYDAPLRLAVAHELVHAWIGERIWVGETRDGREAESWWFTEGVARWVAREQLARAGLLSPDELASESSRLLAILATSPLAAKPMSDLVKMDGSPSARAGVVPLLVARGALFATAMDHRIRSSSRGARSFDDVVRVLAKRAEDRRVAVTLDGFLALVGEVVGDARARQDFDAWIAKGTERRLPDGALGACFEAREAVFEVPDPGFDVDRSATALVGVDPKGPAARAGLKEGERLLAKSAPERAGKLVFVTVERAGRDVTVSYEPSVLKRRGQRFEKRRGISDEACRKLLLRK